MNPSRALLRACEAAGVRDRAVLAAVGAVDRTAFLPPEARREAGRDRPVGIGGGQTTSQPSLIARMIEALDLRPGARVLEVGTGSGYQTALLAHMGVEVVSVERDPLLAAAAADRLRRHPGVTVVVGDGSLGWPAGAPYDAITVGACAPWVPEALVDQLAEEGVLVLPVAGPGGEVVTLVRKVDGVATPPVALLHVRFVPLVGDDAYEG